MQQAVNTYKESNSLKMNNIVDVDMFKHLIR